MSASFSIFSAQWSSREDAAIWAEGKYEITIYSSCCNLEKGIYYYKTYDNHSITAVELHKENLDGEELICYPLA